MSQNNQYTPKRNAIRVIGPSIAYIPLSNGWFSLVDSNDAEMLEQWNWNIHHGGKASVAAYAIRTITIEGKKKNIAIHQMLIDVPEEMVPDHKNGNGLDNRRINLRVVTSSQNSANCPQANNRYGFRGVCKSGRRFYARIKHNRQYIHRGPFDTPEEAGRVAAELAKSFQGEQPYAKQSRKPNPSA